MTSVLVIEDEPGLGRLISWSLLDAGFEVAIVADGDAAIERTASYQPDVIIFNTVVEPDRKEQLIATLRKRTPKSRILDVSEEKNVRASGLIQPRRGETSADAALDIPLPADRLIDAVNDLIGARG